jgi:hypothetical protein
MIRPTRPPFVVDGVPRLSYWDRVAYESRAWRAVASRRGSDCCRDTGGELVLALGDR